MIFDILIQAAVYAQSAELTGALVEIRYWVCLLQPGIYTCQVFPVG